MFRYIRNLRQAMQEDKRLSKYMLYALGEILLVIAGILIALQIDKYAGEVRDRKKLERTLIEIQKELKQDLTLNTFFDIYQDVDSLTSLIMSDSLSIDDYANPDKQEFKRVILGYYRFSSTKHAYNSLMQQLDVVPSDMDTLIYDLNYLYETSQMDVFNEQQELKELISKFTDYHRENHPWLILDNSPKENEYHANSWRFKNNVKEYRSNALAYHFESLIFNYDLTISAYSDISLKLGLKPVYPDSIYNKDYLERYEGLYLQTDSDGVDRTIEIEADDGFLFETVTYSDGREPVETWLRPYAPNRFFTSYTANTILIHFRTKSDTTFDYVAKYENKESIYQYQKRSTD